MTAVHNFNAASAQTLKPGAVAAAVDKGVDYGILRIPHDRAEKKIIAAVTDLLERGADINETNGEINGCTALILAASGGYEELALLLIDKGALVDGKNNNGVTALMCAAARNHTKVVQLLIDRGAGLDVVNDYNKTARDSAALNRNYEIVRLLDAAAEAPLRAAEARTRAEAERIVALHDTAASRQQALRTHRRKLVIKPVEGP